MFSGQTKCVRYYMSFERGLRLMKEVIAQEGHTFDANNRPGTCHCCVHMSGCKPTGFVNLALLTKLPVHPNDSALQKKGAKLADLSLPA